MARAPWLWKGCTLGETGVLLGGGVVGQQDFRAQARGPCPAPMLAQEGVTGHL